MHMDNRCKFQEDHIPKFLSPLTTRMYNIFSEEIDLTLMTEA